MDDQEKKMLKTIKELGLYRVVKHETYEEPKTIDNPKYMGKDPARIVGKTEVYLFDDEELKRAQKRKDGWPDPEGQAIVYCYEGDQFNKGRGRVIATGRALHDFDKEEMHRMKKEARARAKEQRKIRLEKRAQEAET